MMTTKQHTFTTDTAGYTDTGALMGFINGLPRGQQAIIAASLNDRILAHEANHYEATKAVRNSLIIMTTNFMYNLK